MTIEEQDEKPRPVTKPTNVVDFDKIPPALKEHRTKIRTMMEIRCAADDSPIPPKLAYRAADWIFFLAMMRGYERMKHGKPGFPDNETTLNDIARAAESVETVILVMQEEARGELDGLPKILRVT